MLKTKKSLTFLILIALGAGLIAGPFWTSTWNLPVAPLSEFSKAIIQLIKLVAAPLLFFSIIHALLTAEVGLKHGTRMVLVATFNASIALVIGLILTNVLQPGTHLRENLAAIAPAGNATSTPIPPVQKLEFAKTIQSLIPSSWVQPWIDNNILSLVILAVLFGLALRKACFRGAAESESISLSVSKSVTPLGNDFTATSASVTTTVTATDPMLIQLISTLLKMSEIVLGWVVQLTPFAVFGAVTKSVAEYGFSPLKGLAAFLAVGLGGLLIHILVTYHLWIWAYARIPLKFFWKEAKDPVIYSLGANSSLATLPLTLRSLDRLGVSKSSSALGACVGTNLNNDGIILYEAMAMLFVAQASGIDLSLGAQIAAALTCLVAAMGVAGVPEAGFISLSIILTTLGMPTELLPLLLTVDWILARARSATNVLSDMVVSIVIDQDGAKKSNGKF